MIDDVLMEEHEMMRNYILLKQELAVVRSNNQKVNS